MSFWRVSSLHFSQKQSSSLKSHATSGYSSNFQISITCSTPCLYSWSIFFFHMNLIKKNIQRLYYNKALKALFVFPVIKRMYHLPELLNLCRIFICVIIFLSTGYRTSEPTSSLRLNLDNI